MSELSSLSTPGAILLVACYELGHQPLSLAAPLATLRRAGYAPVAVDTSVTPLDDGDLRAARLIAISVPMHTALRLGVRVAERARTLNPDATICFYGLYATLNADYLLQSHADAIIGGEYEEAVVALAQSLEAQTRPAPQPLATKAPSVAAHIAPPARQARKRPRTPTNPTLPPSHRYGKGARGLGLPHIPGVRTREHAETPVLARLPFAIPARETLPPPTKYAQLDWGDGRTTLAGYVEASRGCLHTCLHCPITPVYGGRFFITPREVVLADIREQVAMGARHITFGDPDFLNGPKHSLAILRTMHDEFPDVTFDATIKVEHILERRALMPELATLGCAFVVSAVESLSANVLRHLAKGHTRADVAEALAVLDAAGIPMRPTLVAFTPWTTADDYLDLLAFVAEHDLIDNLDPVQFSIRLLVPPGSALLGADDVGDWLGPLDQAAFSYHWSHPDPRMDALQVAVAALVEATARQSPAPSAATTFAAIRALAEHTLGRHASTRAETPSVMERLMALAPRAKGPLPHLTESWFC